MTRQDKTRQGKARERTTRHDKTRQDKTRQDKTLQNFASAGMRTDDTRLCSSVKTGTGKARLKKEGGRFKFC
jgi:hypothetical protein